MTGIYSPSYGWNDFEISQRAFRNSPSLSNIANRLISIMPMCSLYIHTLDLDEISYSPRL